MKFALLLCLALASCSSVSQPGCFVGFALFPPGPFVVCGIDVNKGEPHDREDPRAP